MLAPGGEGPHDPSRSPTASSSRRRRPTTTSSTSTPRSGSRREPRRPCGRCRTPSSPDSCVPGRRPVSTPTCRAALTGHPPSAAIPTRCTNSTWTKELVADLPPAPPLAFGCRVGFCQRVHRFLGDGRFAATLGGRNWSWLSGERAPGCSAGQLSQNRAVVPAVRHPLIGRTGRGRAPTGGEKTRSSAGAAGRYPRGSAEDCARRTRQDAAIDRAAAQCRNSVSDRGAPTRQPPGLGHAGRRHR